MVGSDIMFSSSSQQPPPSSRNRYHKSDKHGFSYPSQQTRKRPTTNLEFDHLERQLEEEEEEDHYFISPWLLLHSNPILRDISTPLLLPSTTSNSTNISSTSNKINNHEMKNQEIEIDDIGGGMNGLFATHVFLKNNYIISLVESYSFLLILRLKINLI